MKIQDIVPAFEQLNRRLEVLEEHAHTHKGSEDKGDPVTSALEEIFDEPEPEQAAEQPEPEQETEPDPEPEQEAEISTEANTESEAESESRFPADDIPLSELVSLDVRPFDAADVANAIMNHPKLRHARELVMKPETGQMEKVQSFRFTDGTFMVPSRETFERLVAETKIDEVEWVKEVSDCEDICLRFNAKCIELGINSCGRIMSWSGGHCSIIAIVRDGDSLGFSFLEPQTDKFLTDEIGEGMYSLENCLIIIN